MNLEFYDVRFFSNLSFVSRHKVSYLFGGLNSIVICLIYEGLFPGTEVRVVSASLFRGVRYLFLSICVLECEVS